MVYSPWHTADIHLEDLLMCERREAEKFFVEVGLFIQIMARHDVKSRMKCGIGAYET